MSTSVEELAALATELGSADRARLSDLLLASLPDEPERESEVAWIDEIRRRVAQVESGSAELIAAADVHAEARKLYAR